MSRIEKRFARLKADKRAGLVAYVSAGDPNPGLGYEILKGLPKAGAEYRRWAVSTTARIADALDYAHGRGILLHIRCFVVPFHAGVPHAGSRRQVEG